MVVFSLVAAPERGLLAERLRVWRQRRRLATDTVLADLYRLAVQHPKPEEAPHAVSVLRTMAAGAGVRRALQQLAARDLVRTEPDGRWVLTAAGVAAARDLVDGEGGP